MNKAEIIKFAPEPQDVVCSRRGYRLHPGNMFYHKLMKKSALRRRLTKSDNDDVIEAILNAIIEKRHGRFLRPLENNEAYAAVLTRKEADYKVRCDLRTRRARLNANMESKKLLLSAYRQTAIMETIATNPNHGVAAKVAKTTFPRKAIDGGDKNVATKTRATDGISGSNVADGSYKPKKYQKQALRKAYLDPKTVSLNVPVPSAAVCSSTINAETSRSLRKPGNSDYNPQSLLLYGSTNDEIHMRRWLDTHQLPQSVADVLLGLGARCVNDVSLLVKSTPNLLQQLALLDMVKLQHAVQGDIEIEC